MSYTLRPENKVTPAPWNVSLAALQLNITNHFHIGTGYLGEVAAKEKHFEKETSYQGNQPLNK